MLATDGLWLIGLVLTRRHVNGVQPCNSLADAQPRQMITQPLDPFTHRLLASAIISSHDFLHFPPASAP
jgi:hypothetical protein